MALTVLVVKNAQPRAKDYKLGDQRGLYLLVTPKGTKLWKMKYRFAGAERKLSFGAWPEVSLQQARHKCDEARMAIAENRNPARERKLAKLVTRAGLGQTFAAVAEEFVNKREQEGIAKITADKKRHMLAHLKPQLGNVTIGEIETVELFAILDRMQKSGRRETARRMLSFAAEVFTYAIATGRAKANPAQLLRGSLMAPIVKHQPAVVDIDQVKRLLVAIDQSTGYPSTVGALRISPHLFQRPGEIRQMKWDELDLEAGRWTIPDETMKKRREHAVPLSRQVIEIIREMEVTRNGPYVFPAFHSFRRPISENTVNGALKRLGYEGKHTPHGFRSTASTLLNESGLWTYDAIERACSRQVGSAVSAIYNRGLYWDERVAMMQWWSDKLDELRGAH